jgi:hypothetical protein
MAKGKRNFGTGEASAGRRVGKKYVAELEKANGRLQTEVARYEAKQLTLEHRIAALEQRLKEKKVDIQYTLGIRAEEHMPEDALVRELKRYVPAIIRVAPKLGLKIDHVKEE